MKIRVITSSIAFILSASANEAFAACTTFGSDVTCTGTTTTQVNLSTSQNLTVDNGASISPAAGYGVYINNAVTAGDITNNGIINAPWAGIRVYKANGGSEGIVGTIINANGASISGGYTGVWLYDGTATAVINNGAIYNNYSSYGAITLTSSPAVSHINELTNNSTGLIYNQVGSAIKIDFGSSIDTINNYGAVYSLGSGYGINNSGTITNLINAQGASNAHGALTLTGNLPTNYKIYIQSTSNYGQLVGTSVNGRMTFGIASGSTLTAGNTYSSVLSGILSSNLTGSLTGTFGDITWRLSDGSTRNDGIWDLVVTNNNTTFTSSTQTLRPVANGAAAVLDAHTNLSSLFTNLSGAQSYANAAVQTLPLLTGNTIVAAQSSLGRFGGIIQSRQDGLNGLSSGDAVLADREMWIKPFGSWADQHDRGGVSGYSASSGGIAVGADATISPTSRLGVAFGYAHSSITGNSAEAPNSANVDVFQLLGYGSSKLDANTELSYQAGIGQNHTSGHRTLTYVPGTANASYHSLTATAGVGLEKTYKLNEQTSFLPSIRADYTWIKDRAYQETGSAAIAPLLLNVASRSADELVLGINGKLNHKLDKATTFSANAGVGYDAINKQVSITSSYAGAPDASFVTYGMDRSPWLARGGLGLVHKGKNGIEFNARYDAEYRSGYWNHSASVKASWAF